MKTLAGSGVLIQDRNNWYLARVADGKVTFAPVADVEITDRVHAMGDWPGGGVLIAADKGLFLAHEANGKVTIEPADGTDTGHVWLIRPLRGGGILIGSRKGWFVARHTGGRLTLTPAGRPGRCRTRQSHTRSQRRGAHRGREWIVRGCLLASAGLRRALESDPTRLNH